MTLILTQNISSRLQYTVDTVYRHFCGLDYELTNNREHFFASGGEKLNYSDDYIEGIPWIKPSGLLFENKISSINVETGKYRGIPVLFPTKDQRALLPFDIFSAVFYLLSRYEEYLPFTADAFGRFPSTASVAGQQGFLNIPVADHWIEWLLPSFTKKRQFSLCSTIDIDVAYAYRHKGIMRNTGGFAQSLLAFDGDGLIERWRVLSGRLSDPYDTYDFIKAVHQKHGLKPLFFILFADYGPNDKNIAVDNPHFQRLVRELDSFGQVGIHPSFASFRDPDSMATETAGLAAVLGREVNFSRQHFLLLSLPETYRRLIKCGIQRDYSMGYADQPGFRAGTCTPYPFYDLQSESSTTLIIHPFTVMEGTLKDYLKTSPEQALQIMLQLMDEVRKVNGTFTSLWHNESLSDKKRWKGWRTIFESMLKAATEPESKVL